MNRRRVAAAVAMASMAAIPVVSKVGGAPLNAAWCALAAGCAIAIVWFVVVLARHAAGVLTVMEWATIMLAGASSGSDCGPSGPHRRCTGLKTGSHRYRRSTRSAAAASDSSAPHTPR